MDKDVIIRINGMQYADEETGEDRPVEVITPGKYYFKKGLHYLLFDEVDNELNKSRSIIKFSDSYMEVKRSGHIDSNMIFEENKKTKSIYTTPYGTMNIGIATTRIRLNEKENLIELTTDYALELNYDHVADCKISISAVPKTTNISLTS